MRAFVFGVLVCAVAACSGSGGNASSDDGGAGGGGNGDGGSSGGDGSAMPGDGGGSNDGGNGGGGDGNAGADGSSTSPPPPVCDPVAMLVDTSKPTTVVGKGDPSMCTEDALRAALVTGGIVTFSCGAAPVTITVTKELTVAKDTTIDGGGLVTLSGGKSTRILHLTSAFNVATPLLTVQRLTFVDGFTTDVMNTKATTQGGAAIFQDGGSLTVIDCTFSNNQCASTGQDVSGGAINGQGIGKLIVTGSVFDHNSGSNGGAVGTQDEDVTVVNSTFSNNSATGTGGNPGNGGDGGGLSYDGAKIPLTLCGDTFTGNKANAAGGAVFRVAYGNGEPVNIDRCTFDGNSVDLTTGNAGALYLENAAITMSATTISNNAANFGGGFWAGQSAILKLTNVTIANNTSNMGGGIWFASAITGTITNCTVTGNHGDGMFGGDTGVTLVNTLVAGNIASSMPTADHAVNCQKTHGGAGSNVMQYPTGNGQDCVTGVTFSDPGFGMLADNGGPTKTVSIAAASPAAGKGVSCPATDQRGNARPATGCALGAFEPK
jgi:hypothetical protein